MAKQRKNNKANAEEKLIICGYGFTVEVNGTNKPLILDDAGNPVLDVMQRISAQEKLIVPLLQNLGTAWQQELTGLQMAAVKIQGMSAGLHTAFVSPIGQGFVTTAQTDTQKQSHEIGYVTKAGLVYAGVGDKQQHIYTTRDNLEELTWNMAQKRIAQINARQTYTNEFGDARFPTGWESKKNEMLDLFYLNKDIIGGFNFSKEYNHFSPPGIWGPSVSSTLAQVQRFNGNNSENQKSSRFNLRPVWGVNHLVL